MTHNQLMNGEPTNIQLKNYSLQKGNHWFSSTQSVWTSNQQIPHRQR